MIMNLTSGQLDALLESCEKPVLIDFSAAWCGPCRMFAPVFDGAEQTYSDRVQFAKVDVDAAPEMAQRFGVQSIPTLIAIKGGEVVHQSAGYLNATQLSAVIDRLL